MKSVLLVDDDNTILLGTGVRLKSMGYSVYTAKDAVSSAATPIIFITASENLSLRERAMKQGAAAFLKKPFDATTLADAIETALSPGDNWLPRAIGQ
jgi:DNA-binding NtrC family response regulator